MSASITSATVARHGTALSLSLSDGSERLVRLVDLEVVLGTGASERRFEAVRTTERGVQVDYVGGGADAISSRSLLSDAKGVVVIENAGQLVTADGAPEAPLGIIDDGAVVCRGGEIAWVGPTAGLASCGIELAGAERIDAGGRMVTPGLIDCHAHPIFAGDRADEFGRRARGESYQEIAAAGGGINATLLPTRSAGFEEHVALTAARMSRALAAGTTTCEAKSGYALTVEGELRLLEIALAVDAVHPVDLSPTLLGAHLVPPERRDDRDGYVTDVIEQMIPGAKGLARTVDVYCDEGAFGIDETRAILTAAHDAGFTVRAHVGQFADLGGPQLLAELGALSGDHLEQISAEGIEAMAAHGVVAVMLPGACVQLCMTPPPVAELREAGVSLAVASDMNPGTSSCETLPVQMWLATTHYGMTVEEAWMGVTKLAARALGRHDIGVVAIHARADLVVWDAEIPAEIPYHYGANLVHQIIKSGRLV